MTSRVWLRPVFGLCLAGLATACGPAAEDGRRFESWADGVAAIPVERTVRTSSPSARDGLRPSVETVRVEVMDPHDLWDARDGGLRGMVEQAAPDLVEAAAPAVAEAVLEQVAHRGLRPTPDTTPPPSSREAEPSAPIIQLGAYSSRAAAEAAWTRFGQGPVASALSGGRPVFETVEVSGRTLVRLKVAGLSAERAATVCRLAAVADAWCRRA